MDANGEAMTKKTDMLLEAIPLFLSDKESQEMVQVAEAYFNEEDREVRVCLKSYECDFSVRELQHLAEQARIACERILG